MITDLDFRECLACRCAAARREAARLTRLYDDKLRPYELSISQFTMLTALIVGGPATIGVLAERLGIDRTTLTRNIALSIERGVVETVPGADARERLVQITETGRGKAQKALPAWRLAQSMAAEA